MQTAVSTRAQNFRRNLRRVFDAGVVQIVVAKKAGIHQTHLARILSGAIPNPGLDKVDAIAEALEVPLETLLSPDPAAADLGIEKNPPNRACGS